LTEARFHNTLTPVTFTVPGDPQGKGRARSFLMKTGRIGHHTPTKTRSYEGVITSLAMDAMQGRVPFEAPVHLDMTAIFPVPQSYSKTRTALALSGALRPGKKPDLDNIAKAITDAINTVVVKDDALIVSASLAKKYGPQAMVVVTVRAV
jgi:Holliday junction resolvase RusA-like endonuclease